MKTSIRNTKNGRRLPADAGGPRGAALPSPGLRGFAAPGAMPLHVGPVTDNYEQEADRLAGRIVDEMNAPGGSRAPAASVTPVRLPASPHGTGRDGALHSGRLAASQGDRLPTPLRQAAERVLGRDLTAVRVHSGPDARRLTQSVGADAVASSNHVFLGHAMATGSAAHAELLAHEVAHTVQQSGLAAATPFAQRGFLDRFKRRNRARALDSEEDQPLAPAEAEVPSLKQILKEHGATRKTPAVVLNAKYRAALMRAEEEAGERMGPPELSEDSKQNIRDLRVTKERVQGDSGLTGMVDLETNTAHAKSYLAEPGRVTAHEQQALDYHGLHRGEVHEMNPFDNKAGFSIGHKSTEGLHVRFAGNTFNTPNFGDRFLPQAERIKVMRALAQSGQPVRYGYADTEVRTVLQQRINRDEAELTAALVGQKSVLPKGVSADQLQPPPTVTTLPENEEQIAAGIRGLKRRRRGRRD